MTYSLLCMHTAASDSSSTYPSSCTPPARLQFLLPRPQHDSGCRGHCKLHTSLQTMQHAASKPTLTGRNYAMSATVTRPRQVAQCCTQQPNTHMPRVASLKHIQREAAGVNSASGANHCQQIAAASHNMCKPAASSKPPAHNTGMCRHYAASIP